MLVGWLVGWPVVGCADIKLTAGMWQLPSPLVRHRQDDTAEDARNTQRHRVRPGHQLRQQQRDVVIRCNATGEQWRLTCRDNSWVGQFGNCSPGAAKRESPPAASIVMHDTNTAAPTVPAS